MEIEAAEARRRLPELTELLVDAVDGGGGNGFLRPLAPSVASAYWEGRIGDIESGRSILLGVARRPMGRCWASSSSTSPDSRTDSIGPR